MPRQGLSIRTRLLPGLLLLLASLPPFANAQYKWVDESGRVVYSDRPPAAPREGVQVMRGGMVVPQAPPSGAAGAQAGAVALGQNTGSQTNAAQPSAAGTGPTDGRPPAAAATTQPSAASGQPAYVERDLAFRKRQQEREAAERKQAEQAQQAAQLARLCEERRTDLRTLETGGRLRRVDANGEASFMTEEDIAQRRESLKKSISAECRAG